MVCTKQKRLTDGNQAKNGDTDRQTDTDTRLTASFPGQSA